jgi:hypothetical protein
MKLNSDGICERTRKLLVIAQLLTLASFALGLAFVLKPTPVILFLFASLSPVLALAAVFIFVTQRIATYHGRQMREVVSCRGNRTETKVIRSPWLDEADRVDQVDPRTLISARSGTARSN